MNDCLFCKIVNGEIPSEKVFENESTFVFLDIGPVSKGHLLVIPKRHAKDLQSGSVDDALEIMKTVYKIAPAVMKALQATGYNLGMNHGVDAGQDVFHTHVHFMPRYENDTRRFVKTRPSKEELFEIGELIRNEVKNLES